MRSLQDRTITVELKTKRDAARFDAMVGERLLFAGLRSGLDLPYECASGVCGSCQAQVVNGSMAAIRNLFLFSLHCTNVASSSWTG